MSDKRTIKNLAVFDFDHTIVEDNTGEIFIRLFTAFSCLLVGRPNKELSEKTVIRLFDFAKNTLSVLVSK